MPKNIDIDQAALAGFCKRHKIAKLSLFGSVLRDDFGPDSDVDCLVEFEPGAHKSLFKIITMQNELGEMLGRKVDLTTPKSLSKYFRDDVLKRAEVLYVAA